MRSHARAQIISSLITSLGIVSFRPASGMHHSTEVVSTFGKIEFGNVKLVCELKFPNVFAQGNERKSPLHIGALQFQKNQRSRTGPFYRWNTLCGKHTIV
jgi:hypothetical protein